MLVDVPVEHSMNGRSPSESSTITLDNFALLIRIRLFYNVLFMIALLHFK